MYPSVCVYGIYQLIKVAFTSPCQLLAVNCIPADGRLLRLVLPRKLQLFCPDVTQKVLHSFEPK